jgi:hypothetical protein
MKMKILETVTVITAIILLVVLAGFVLTSPGKEIPVHDTHDRLTGNCKIMTFTYRNHDYIRFGTTNADAVLHDPDCKCQKLK